MNQHGFFFDQSRCIGCNACVVACKQWHNIQPGPVKWMRVFQWEKNSFPNIRVHILAINCYHCKRPTCLMACPNKAIYKEEKYGAVLVDNEKCEGLRKCWLACPYGAPQYEDDKKNTKMTKCNMCIDRLEEGLTPICVLSCSMRALEFGKIDDLEKKYGNLRILEDLPKDKITNPAVVFKQADPKKQIIPWDHHKAIELWQKRNNTEKEFLPDVFDNLSNVLQAPTDIVGRNKLVLKPKNVEEVMYYTTDDE